MVLLSGFALLFVCGADTLCQVCRSSNFAIFSGDVLFMTLNLFCKLCKRVCNIIGKKLCAKFHCNLFFLCGFGETVSDSVSEIWLNSAKYV